ncbi:putative oxidoreductase [Cladobotryum mycophilum]|uniref:Oxidoreductase n=1 Tax=Cladobotryum mycophilum TaxID=491253 RepID=A0ABR0SAT6_9HYPO
MVALPQVESSNSRVGSSLPANLAVFAGATSGIGELALKSFAKHAANPKIYFIGRSNEAGERIKQDLKNVDKVSALIKESETTINLLFMSQGTLRMGSETSEGLPYIMAVSYYSRMRLATNLLPLLRQASSLRRLVSVFAGTKEGTLYPDDIPGRKVSLTASRGHLCTAMTLYLEGLARQAPDVSFIHNMPGSVNTNLIRKEDGMMLQVLNFSIKFMLRNKFMDNDECGERHAFLCTSGMYPSKDEGGGDGVPLEKGLESATGTDGNKASGVYTVDWDGEGPPRV